MSSLNGMNGRAHKVEAAAPKPVEGLYLIYAEEFAPLDRLTHEEQAALEAFIARVQPKLDRGLTGPGPAGSRGYPDMSGLSNEDLFEWHLWARLGGALWRDDLEAAAKWRRYLIEGTWQLIESFLSIDEMSIPAAGSQQERFVREEWGIYPLSRIQYRYERDSIQRRRDRLFGEDVDMMHRWLDAFGEEDAG